MLTGPYSSPLGANVLPAGRKSKKYDFLGGGLVTRPDDRYINLLNDKGHFYSPSETNVQFTKIASIQKRLGYKKVGNDVQNAVFYSQTSKSSGLAVATAIDGQKTVLLKKITAGSTSTIVSVIAALRITAGLSNAGLNARFFKNIKCFITLDNAGVPGLKIGSSNSFNDGLEIGASATNAPSLFYFPSPVILTNTNDYWIWIEAEAITGATAAGVNFNWLGVTATSGTSSYSTDGGFTLVSSTINPYLFVYTEDKPVLGIYDYRPEAGGVVTQFVMVAVNGTLYSETAGSYTSIATGLASTANSLYDFSTLKNLLFSCDYATHNNQAWDGAAAATMTHGYRGTMSALGQSGSSGGPWSATGIVKVILVTALRSGGLRVSVPFSITLASTTNKIDLTGIAVDAIAAQFSFDIGTTATTIYCTLPNGAIYYKVPAASLSTNGNPIANTQTTNSILPMTDATLKAGGSFETNTSYPQGYATGQVDTPKSKYMDVFQNMLCIAGDPNNPSRVWFSEQYAPQVWGDGSSGSGLLGDFLDIAVDDGEQVTGLAVADGALMVGKQTGIYRVDYTGNATNTFSVRKVHGQVGVLSNWTMQIIPDGLFFLSERGPAICYGTYSDILPQTSLIQNLFDNTSPESFDLASMAQAVACNDTTRNQVLITVSSPDVSIRDRILSYDYEQKMFALYDGYQANYLANIDDANGFPVFWTGNLSGQVFQRSSSPGITPYLDNGTAIIVTFETPNIDFGDPSSWAQVDFLHISGKVQTSGNLYIDFFADDSATYYRTISLDMTNPKFGTGLAVRVGAIGKSFKYRIRSVDFTGVSSCELHWMRLEWSEASGTRLG